ncbi:MAG: acyltransferase family protein [Azonexus sp.]
MTIRNDSFISAELSVYLDAVRFIAALAVLVGHLDQDGLYASWLLIGDFSHAAVVVFFVLSGLVISHSAFSRERDWRAYTVARVARIQSVVLPAIVLSFAIKACAAWLDPLGLSAEFAGTDLQIGNLLGSLFFLNESWGLGTTLPWNGPYWSLCYEVWYYIIFGLALFAPGSSRHWWVVLAALIAGPAIMLLFPIWLLGSWLARHGAGVLQSPMTSGILWVVSLLLFCVLNQSGLPSLISHRLYETVPGFWRLEASQRFLTDYLLAILVAINFVAFRGLGARMSRVIAVIKAPATLGAGYTFSLYLYHRPLTHFAGHFFPNREQSEVVTLLWLSLIIGFCILLGAITERKKHVFRAWARRIVGG